MLQQFSQLAYNLWGYTSFRYKSGFDHLLFHQAAMTGHAEPFTMLKHPRIGKASEMLIRLAAVGAFRVINTRYDSRAGVHLYLHVLGIHEARPEFKKTGGEGGIRTLDTGVSPYNGLAK
jgi:hypothetical protein